ncbi:MAG: DUF3179 domain-containing protein [Planctomycetes bacterium]|nr:DUF3179 domain-containing protein [Planctomycetota bacterium]
MRSIFWLLLFLIARPGLAAEPGEIVELPYADSSSDGTSSATRSKPGEIVALPYAFKTLVNPDCSHCRDEAARRSSELRDDDRVLCWTRGYSDGGAIPLRFFLNTYRVISDSYGVFVYDPDAGYARGFAPSYDFTFYGWRNGIMVMKHKDGTLYSCLSGLAFDGPKKGSRLEAVPTLMSDWGFWLKRYPGNVAYQMFDKYQPLDLTSTVNKNSKDSRIPVDKRLSADQEVLGVVEDGKAKAYLIDALSKRGVIQETVDGQSRILLWYAPTQTAAAYQPLASPPSEDNQDKPQEVTLKLDEGDPMAPFVDAETGSRWDIAGRAVEGKLKDWTLKWLDGTQVKWFAWAAEYPETFIYEGSETSR